MEFTLYVICTLILAALVCELIDSSMGMLYGTILSPALIIVGFSPLVVIPSILLSQALSGLTASFIHHRLKNAEFKLKIRSPKIIYASVQNVGYFETIRKGISNDLRATLCIAVLGVIVTVTAVLVSVHIPPIALQTYIGVLVLAMGIILLSRLRFQYTWKKIFGLGLLSAFNKGISGGGFGPVATAGQIIAGRNNGSSVGATTLAEVPICLTGFVTYVVVKGLADWSLPLYLTIGALLGACLGPHVTAKFRDDKKLRKALGVLVAALGVWTLLKVYVL
ncbi:MAG: sulfite exporter TauE/SafE family protein [Patescibacteria group bacterium]